MEERHLNRRSRPMHLYEINQHQDPNSVTAEWSYMHRGRVIAPESVPTTEYNIASRPIEHSPLSLRLGDSQFHAPHSVPSHYSFLPPPRTGSFYAPSENSANHSHSIHSDRSAYCKVEDGLLDHGMNTGRGQFKRKSHISSSCDRGSTSRFHTVGSSSNSSDHPLGKTASCYPNYPPCTIGLPVYRGANLSGHSADPPRNVRSRPRTDLEHNPRTIYPSSYFSHHYCPTTYLPSDSDRANFTCFGTGTATYNHNNIGVFPPTHGRFQASGDTGIRNETNQYYVGGSAAEVGGNRHEPVSSAEYFHSLHDQAMEVSGNYSQGAVTSYGAGVRFTQGPQETTPTTNDLPSIPEAHSSRFSRPFSARSWRNNHRETRSRIAAERFQSFSNPVNAHHRMQSEALTLEEHTFSYRSRNHIDEYRDLRLDVDNMSYEELLALGERIGNVNTGLPEDAMSECLKETTYSSDKKQQEANCAICLEEYKKNNRIGTLSCGHDYHVLCIKRWLGMKNGCPICKAPALADIVKEE